MPKFAPFRSTHDLSITDFDKPTRAGDAHKYDAVRNLEDGSESSTEVEEWDQDKEDRPRRMRKKRGFWAKAKRWRWVVDTALLVVIVGLLVEKKWRKSEHHRTHRHQVLGDLTGFAPSFSQQIVSFKPDPIFAPENASAFWDQRTQEAWLSIVPRGLGYLLVKEPENYDDLPQPIHDYPGQTVFTTSMTHQLHCLYTILDAYNLVLTTLDPSAIEMPWHVNHCFEYIRQGIMCAGDVALEGAATTFPLDDAGEDRGGSDGWDAKHICKDYGEVYRYLERETVNLGDKWISS